MSSYNHLGCSCCGGPFNGENCPSCSSVGSGNEFVYDPNPYSYNETPNFFNQPPQHQYETYSCEFCGGSSHPGFDCQTRNIPIFDQGPCYNQDFGFNQPPHYSPSQPLTYSCELCGNDAHYGYDCPPQVPFIYNPEPCYNQDFDNDFPQSFQSYPQQYLCCENCGGPHETFQCQPLNQNFYEPNHCYNSNSFGFDQFQPPQFPVIHQPPQEMSIQDMKDPKQQYLGEMKSLINEFPIKDYRDDKIDIKINELKENFNGMSIEINKKKKLQRLEPVANLRTYPLRLFNSFCYDDDDDDEEYTIAITPVLPTEEPDNSLSVGDEHLSTIPETESDKLIKSSVENLVPFPSEFEDFSDIKSECDVPVCDNFTTFSNPLFDADNDFSSSDNESLSDEDIPKEIYSNPLFDEEIISTKIDPHHFNAESDLRESFLNQDTSIISSPKIDSLLEEFSDELAHIINEADFGS
ncbi:hypothetical protein Tco_0247108 [Tanacetum coccineum]